jgi:hypothetical protein
VVEAAANDEKEKEVRRQEADGGWPIAANRDSGLRRKSFARRSFPRNRESTFFRSDVDRRLPRGDDAPDFHPFGWAAGPGTQEAIPGQASNDRRGGAKSPATWG